MDSITFAYPSILPRKKPWGRDLEKVNANWFYDLARELRAVAALPEEGEADPAVWPIIRARYRLEQLVKNSDPIPLGVSKAMAQTLIENLNACMDEFSVDDGQGNKKFEWPKSGQTTSAWMFLAYRNTLEKFETVFAAEMAEAATYFVPRRGIYNTAALVDSADEAFPEEIRGSIPRKSRDDWRSAGRCLAFSLFPASGFHVARAVEGTLELYYQTFTGKSGTLRSWHDYIEALEKATGPNLPTAKTIAEIKQMKDDYRNPIVHPRVVLNEPEARILFDNGESLIMAMACEIKAALLAPSPTPTPLEPHATEEARPEASAKE